MIGIAKTPWPIELGEHPFGQRKKNSQIVGQNHENNRRETTTEKSKIEIVKECFSHPEKYRNLILENISVEPLERFEGKSVYYMWLNKVCPVGCEFCFFKSPSECEDSPENEISDEGIEKIIQLTKDAQIDKFVVSGGGEPMKARKKVNDLAKGVNTKEFIVVTSAYWSKGKNSTNKVLSDLLENASNNPNQPQTTIRVSLDECHFERLSKDETFQYINNIIDWFSEKAIDNPNFKLAFHTIDGDTTVEKLLSQLSIESREESGDYCNRRGKIKLENGLTFSTEYTQLFFSSPFVNLKDEEEQRLNQETFKKFIFDKRGGNMSLSFHGGQPKGAYHLTFYDGTTILWGATAPDTESSIYNDDYASIMDRNLKDVLTLGILEKGQFHMQEIVGEISPKAVERTIGVGLRDFYGRLLLEEDLVRLYASIRIIQEYLIENRITAEEQESWPEEIKVLVSLSLDELKKACLESPKTIIQQYLEDPTVSVEKLIALNTRIALGHYSLKTEDMYKAVREANIDSEIKQQFIEVCFPSQSNLSSI